MTTLIPLFATFFGLSAIGWLCGRHSPLSVRARIAAAVMFFATGSSHFANPEPFVQMIPPQLPFPELLVFWTGALEILGGVGLLLRRTHRRAALALAAFLVAVLPANIHAAINHVGVGAHADGPEYLWIRIPVQVFLIGWILWAGLSRDGTRGILGGDVGRTRAPGRPVSLHC